MSFFKSTNPKARYNALTLLVLIMLGIVLFFGLRPKGWSSANNIHWLPEQEALSFHYPGIAYVDDVHIFATRQHADAFTIEMIVAPESTGKPGFRPMLTLHNGDDLQQLTIWHWGASVIVMNGDDYDSSRKLPRISAHDALTPGEASFITVTSGDTGTSLFINETLAKKIDGWQLTLPDSTKKLQLILGNSVYGKHSWEGKIYGLAVYGKALSSERVKHHYERWRQQGNLAVDTGDDPLLLYTFSEYADRLVPDQTDRNQQLQVPLQQVALKKTFLFSPWHHFTPSRSFFIDAILNFVGFLPLGAVICYWLRQSSSWPGRHGALVTVGFCFFLSLGMEVAQVWLPNRTSSLLDLTLNTLGSCFGVLLVDIIQKTRANKPNNDLIT
jgi:VanZ family protein